ncbi:hypothetical protein OSSY52_15240 [Tepiditoga spiralis]|uniref:DUF3307 domain-containing protein n=1 Tax=Tepiditoga spiralis TaxID=2108365 RepID=A0A7G1G8Y5_9BACT|nr:DUF3307 domain-containing protein [Tepiditoga spiralis]BBE31383.1 hypothetical protein OSSY52_15240 [Tepiditoga spiralis]
MNYFFYFLLSHFIGDYFLQTNFIARYKNSKISVLLLHVSLIYLSMLIIIFPKNITNHILILSLTGIHLLIDTFKFKYKNKKFFKGSHYYLFDQILHLTSLMIISYFFKPQSFFFPQKYALIISLGLFNAYFIGILSSFIFNDITKYTKDKLGYILRFSIPFMLNPFLILSSVPVYSYIYYKHYKKSTNKSLEEVLFSLYWSYLITLLIIITSEVKL